MSAAQEQHPDEPTGPRFTRGGLIPGPHPTPLRPVHLHDHELIHHADGTAITWLETRLLAALANGHDEGTPIPAPRKRTP